jgi:hypothetical protein
MNFINNRVGAELYNTPTTIRQSNFTGNQIDIIAENSPIQLIDSIVSNILQRIDSIPRDDIYIDPYEIEAKARDILATDNPISKRLKFKNFLNRIWQLGRHALTLYGLVKMAWDIYRGFSG